MGFGLSALVLALMISAGVTPAQADVVWNYTITGTGITGTGTLTTGTSVSPGVLPIVSWTGNFADVSNGISGVVTDPFALPTGGTMVSPDGLYYFDNVLTPSAPSLLTTAGGGLFDVGGGPGAGGAEVNIAADGLGGWWLWMTTPTATYDPGSGAGYEVNFTVTPADATTPEPGSVALFGFGLAGAVWLGRWRCVPNPFRRQ